MKSNKQINITYLIVLGIALVLFIVPFFWLRSGFVDLGGDAGRLYFLDPSAVTTYLYNQQNMNGATTYAIVIYTFVLSLLKKVISSETNLLSLEHGIRLSLGFFSIFLIVKNLLCMLDKSSVRQKHIAYLTGIVSGIVYIGFITKNGWVTSLETQNQVFLNPLMFYFLFQLGVTGQFRYGFLLLATSLLYSGNFGFSNMPQLCAFYPLTVLFLFCLMRFVLQKPIPWKQYILLGLLFIGLHSFHLIPTIASISDVTTHAYSYIFSSEVHQNAGVNYFDANRQTLGKLSWELFQPARWNGQTLVILFIPLIILGAFLLKHSRLSKPLVMTAGFFALTFFLVSANITIAGIKIYRNLFYIPGFLMFRSFDDKWYYVYIFFYTLLFGIAFYLLTRSRKFTIAVCLGLVIVCSVFYRILPFLKGDFYAITHYTSLNVPVVFTLDRNVLDALSYVKTMPSDGSVLTLPLTLPYYQIAYGKEGGAYVGISMVRMIGGKKDYPGLWTFGLYQKNITEALKTADSRGVLQLLSLLNIKYVFRNTDNRIVDNFPRYPYYRFDMTTDIPTINSQDTYSQFFSTFPMSEQYAKGYYHVYKIDESYIRPTVYIPDILYATLDELLIGSSFRSAYIEKSLCDYLQNNQSSPNITFQRISNQNYSVTIDLGERKEPFVVVLLDTYHPGWSLGFQELNNNTSMTHVVINGDKNAWIIDPEKLHVSGVLHGTIRLTFQKYYTIGRIISIGTSVLILVFIGVVVFTKKINEKI